MPDDDYFVGSLRVVLGQLDGQYAMFEPGDVDPRWSPVAVLLIHFRAFESHAEILGLDVSDDADG